MSQASQQLIRRVIGVSVMGAGLIIILWGLGQYFQKHGPGLLGVTFGLVIMVAGYAIWQQGKL